MNIKGLLLLILPCVVLLGACGHTNQLAKYNISGRTALFRSFASGDAASSVSVIESPSQNTVGKVIAAIGSAITSDQARRKLERAINGDSIAHSISSGIRNATADYLSIKPVEGIVNDPDLIIETEVTEYNLVSTAAGISMRVRGTSRVIDRKSGDVVWDDAESYTVPLSETYPHGS
jgi:hypothetical protein